MIKVFFTLICLLLTLSGQAQIQKKLETISSEIEKTLTAENIPAISVGIIYQDKKYFINKGRVNRKQTQGVDEHSIYQIASLGKTFIGVIINHLLIDDKIQITQAITDFIDPVFSEARTKKLKTITIEALLHHTSGLPQDARAGYSRKDGEPYQYDYTEEDLYTDLKNLPIKSKKKYQYSNIGYALLAYIAEKATQKTYNDLLHQYVIDPFALSHTTFTLSENQKSLLVTPYRKDKRMLETEPWEMGKLAPPSALYSTTADLCKILEVHIKAYQEYVENKKQSGWILTQNTLPLTKHSQPSYGYGFVSWGGGTYGHSGDMDGYAVDYSITPEKKMGLVLLTSSGEHWIGPLIRKINKILAK